MKTKSVDDPLAKLDAFLLETTMEERQPDEYTVKELASHWGCPRQTACHRIQKAVDGGVLTTRLGKLDGRTCRLYKVA